MLKTIFIPAYFKPILQNVAENMVWSCRNCNLARGNKGIFEWLGLEKKDKLHSPNCHNTHARVEWGTEGKLTCFCLESIF